LIGTKASRKILITIAVIFCCLAIYQWGLAPLYNYKDSLQNKVEHLKNRLLEFKELKNQYIKIRDQLSGQNKDTLQNTPDFTLFSFIEEKASQEKLKKHIEFMRPASNNLNSGRTEHQVQMQLRKIHLTKLINFLKHIEHSPKGIYIKRMNIRSPKDRAGELQVNLLFATQEANDQL